MKKSGFVNIRCESIGKDVFNGFDVWMTQNGYERSWGREWLKAYNRGLVDYYVISAGKNPGRKVMAIVPWDEYEVIAETREILNDKAAIRGIRRGIGEAKAGKMRDAGAVRRRLGL